MTDIPKLPDPSAFAVNERPREYRIVFDVRGTVTLTISADSLEDAKLVAAAVAEAEDFSYDLDSADEVKVTSVRKTPRMYLVTRDGKAMQTSHLEPGDLPRQPDDRGF